MSIYYFYYAKILFFFTQHIKPRNFPPSANPTSENICMVCGIGCSSRIPYYVDTYGFHSIHGRACTIATDVKLANPALSVWVSMGDEDQMEEQMANRAFPEKCYFCRDISNVNEKRSKTR